MARPKDKKETILEAAFEVYAEKGFKSASMQDIATRAGLGKGTLYEYFKNKDELFVEGIRCQAESGLEKAQDFLNKSGTTAVEKLESMISFTQHFMKETDFLFKFIVAGDLFGLNPEYTKRLQKVLGGVRERHVSIYRQILEQGVRDGEIRDIDLAFTADAAAELVTAYLHIGMLKESFCGIPQSDSPEVQRTKLMDLLMNGIGARKGLADNTSVWGDGQ